MKENQEREEAQSQSIDTVIDIKPIWDDWRTTQINWSLLFNQQVGEFEGKRMINSADVINASEYATPEEIEGLQKTCEEYGLITATQLFYHPHYINSEFLSYAPGEGLDNLRAKLTLNLASTVAEPKETYLDEVPILEGVSARNVVDMSKGLRYLRALADDEWAEPATLLNRLATLANRDPDDILFWTSNRQDRGRFQLVPVKFAYEGKRFHITGGFNREGNIILGYTHGVKLDSVGKNTDQTSNLVVLQ
jgi:hypothetical protein